jgi:hypothetical protein
MHPRHILIAFLLGLTATSGIPASASDVEDKLDQPVKNYNLTGTLEEAIAALQEQTELSLLIDWEELNAVGVKKTDKVMLKGSSASLANLLDMLLAQVSKSGKPLAWKHIGGSQSILLTSQRFIMTGRATAGADASGQSRDARGDDRPSGIARRGFRYEETPLETVLQDMRRQAQVNMFINWRALETEGIEKDTAITFEAKNISTAQALDLVMQQLNADKGIYSSIYWVVDEGIVTITTGNELSKKMKQKVFDVADLLHVVPDFKAERVNLQAIGGNGNDNDDNDSSGGLFDDDDDDDDGDDDEPSMRELREKQEEKLIQVVKQSIPEELWHPQGKGTITLFQNRLIINQSLLGWKLMEESVSR